MRCCARALPGGFLLLLVLQGSLLGQDWVMPERSQANLDALARVELETYEMPQAGGAQMEYRVYTSPPDTTGVVRRRWSSLYTAWGAARCT